MIMMSKQAMDLMYLLMIIFTLCQSNAPKTGIAFTFDFI